MRDDLPSGTVTFVFTDVEGSTKLLDELGAAADADALAGHRRVVREACASEGGVEVDTQGDVFFFAFPTAPGALSAASRMTEALAPGPIQVRIGLHTSTPLVTEEGYVGDDVHFAPTRSCALEGDRGAELLDTTMASVNSALRRHARRSVRTACARPSPERKWTTCSAGSKRATSRRSRRTTSTASCR
jgi:Adenylate and Guanylate cyclase catalytic domain